MNKLYSEKELASMNKAMDAHFTRSDACHVCFRTCEHKQATGKLYASVTKCLSCNSFVDRDNSHIGNIMQLQRELLGLTLEQAANKHAETQSEREACENKINAELLASWETLGDWQAHVDNAVISYKQSLAKWMEAHNQQQEDQQ